MTKSLELTLYYANWCGHCVKFKKSWEEIKSGIKKINNEYKGVKISANEFEEKQLKHGGKINGKDIDGYPTLKITLEAGKEHKEYEYKKEHDVKTILNYIKKISDGLVKYKDRSS
jgi:glutaredoxin